MQPASNSPRGASGASLIITAVVLALAPVVLEMISDGGPSKFGKPETGFAMVAAGLVLWPVAIICFLIGMNRWLAATTQQSEAPRKQEQPATHATITDAWAETNKTAINNNEPKVQQ